LTDPFVARELSLCGGIEAAALRALHRGSHHCAWRADTFDAAAKALDPHKRRTNALLAAAAAAAVHEGALRPGRDASALLLDAATGETSAALADAAGFSRSRIFAPNTSTPSVAALRSGAGGVRAYVGDIGEHLRRRPCWWEPFTLIHLDYCSGVHKRRHDITAVFAAHALAHGGVLGLGFSHRDVGTALEARRGEPAPRYAKRLVAGAAAAHGYEATCVAAHDYDGMFFLAFRVHVAAGAGAGSRRAQAAAATAAAEATADAAREAREAGGSARAR
jgi:hypothetical protein